MKKTVFCCITVLLMACILCLPLFSAADVPASLSSYILGDTDGDGSVTILDATYIQRILAHLKDDTDGTYTLRGDADGDGILSAADVTLIMRFLAGLKTGYPIGAAIEAPTEAETLEPTQAETAAPTVKPTAKPDPYELPPV